MATRIRDQYSTNPCLDYPYENNSNKKYYAYGKQIDENNSNKKYYVYGKQIDANNSFKKEHRNQYENSTPWNTLGKYSDKRADYILSLFIVTDSYGNAEKYECDLVFDDNITVNSLFHETRFYQNNDMFREIDHRYNSETFYQNGLLHNKNGPAKIFFDHYTKEKIKENYYLEGIKLTKKEWLNQIKPSVINQINDGIDNIVKVLNENKDNTKISKQVIVPWSEDFVPYLNEGDNLFYDNVKVMKSGDDIYFFKNDLAHRENDLPAVSIGGYHFVWCQNGKITRETGEPAVIHNEEKMYYIDDVLYSKADYFKKINPEVKQEIEKEFKKEINIHQESFLDRLTKATSSSFQRNASKIAFDLFYLAIKKASDKTKTKKVKKIVDSEVFKQAVKFSFGMLIPQIDLFKENELIQNIAFEFQVQTIEMAENEFFNKVFNIVANSFNKNKDKALDINFAENIAEQVLQEPIEDLEDLYVEYQQLTMSN